MKDKIEKTAKFHSKNNVLAEKKAVFPQPKQLWNRKQKKWSINSTKTSKITPKSK